MPKITNAAELITLKFSLSFNINQPKISPKIGVKNAKLATPEAG